MDNGHLLFNRFIERSENTADVDDLVIND